MAEKKGIVYLVGAGPGDPALLTLRGRECLAAADVVIYDRLANTELLDLAEGASEVIYAGKSAGQHAMPQEEISAILVEKGRAGNTVARLKGGDPYLFGRGAEEALTLREADIPFEVVPGITAALGASMYAGIPLTHREHSSTVTLITGHEDPAKDESTIDWAALATGGGTLVFYMGVGNLPGIAARLIEGGRPDSTPAALVRWGTLPRQEVLEAPLAKIAERAAAAGIAPPAILIVGGVVALREGLDWFTARPLFGRTIMVTRSREQASRLVRRLARLGARVIPLSTISFGPPEDEAPLRDAVRRPAEFDWIIFTSVNGVARFFSALRAEGGDSRRLASCRICCIGHETASRLAEHGIAADMVPPRFTSQSIFETLQERERLVGVRILLPRANIAGRDLPRMLAESGAEVTDVQAYRTLPGEPSPEALEALASGEIDLVTFTSSSTARNFAVIARERCGGPPKGVQYASIGPVTSATAREEGMEIAFEAEVQTIDGLVETIVRRLGADR